MLKTGGSVKIKRILVYGPIGSGKSSVLKLFKEWGAFTLDCDHITHKILEHDPEVLPILTDYFGSFILEKGKISRKKLSSAAFASKKNLLALETILHPRIFKEVERLFLKNRDLGAKAFVVEASIYPKIQGDWESFFDSRILVTASREIRLERAKDKGFSEEEFTIRTEHQLPSKTLESHADIILENNLSFNELKQQFIHKVTT
ncbi:MAG: dephospho-CoA kinase [Chlamydiae bacterium]|nr:dephospho-CoA kinase [Chlamydiota bacterium]